MFTIGAIIFTLYLLGYVMMINKAHSSQQVDLENDPELILYYRKKDLNRVLNILVQLAKSDGHISQDEKTMINRIGKENSLAPNQIEALIKEPKPIGIIQDLPKESKLELIIDIIRLMKIDEQVHQKEMKFCKSIAVKLGYNTDVIKDLLNYISNTAQENSDKKLLKEIINKFYKS